jgi:hypothetical protein
MMKRWISLLAVAIILILAAFGVWQKKYDIYDFVRLRNYNPPAAVVQLAKDTTMTSKAKNIFYANHPQISDRQTFAKQCLTSNNQEATIVLGCYDRTGIYIFKVTDVQLNGVEQVTAAHEMLHAAYDRLSSSERKKIDSLVMAQFANLNDPRISQLAKSYEKQKPGSVPNEMHSIIATEVKEIDSELENYYMRYFTNRQKIVEFASSYQKKFEDLKALVEKIDGDLALRKSEIDNKEQQLKLLQSDLQSEKAQMDKLFVSGQNRAYNNLVEDYNNKVSQYNQGVEDVKQIIEEYNRLVWQRNEYALRQQVLAKNIDSRLTTIQEQ